MDSIKQAGLSFCRTEWSVVSNVASAPFDKAGFSCRYAEAAKEFLDNNDCTNDLFLAAIPILSLDQHDGVLPDGFKSPERMARTWESLRGCSTFLTKGEKIKAARWFRFNRRTRDVLSKASSLLLMITYIGMLDRWFDHVLVGCWVQRNPDDNPAAADENEEDGRRPEGAPGNEHAIVAGCAEPPRGVQLSDWDIEQQRASKNNTLAYVTDILSCRSTRAMTVVIVDVSLPLEVEAGKTCRYRESPDGVFSWHLKMATACGLHVVHECVDAGYSEFLAQRMGVCDEAMERMPLSEATIQTMAHAVGDFLRLIISKELLFQRTYFDCIPGKFVALVSNDDEERQQALEFCRRSFESSRSWSTLTGTQESCTTPSCGPWPPGRVRFF